MTALKNLLLTSLPLALALGGGCATDPAPTDRSDTCRDGKCDDLDLPDSEVAASPCDGVMVDASGRGNSKVAGRLNDPLANSVFKVGEDCPTSFADIMDKLRLNDNEGCAEETSGIKTRVVSETAQATGAPTSWSSRSSV